MFLFCYLKIIKVIKWLVNDGDYATAGTGVLRLSRPSAVAHTVGGQNFWATVVVATSGTMVEVRCTAPVEEEVGKRKGCVSGVYLMGTTAVHQGHHTLGVSGDVGHGVDGVFLGRYGGVMLRTSTLSPDCNTKLRTLRS